MNTEGEANLSGRIISRIKEIAILEINEAKDFRQEVLQLKLQNLKNQSEQ